MKAEVAAMQAIIDILEDLDPAVRSRVLRFATSWAKDGVGTGADFVLILEEQSDGEL